MRKEPKAMMIEHELFRPANSILYNFRDNFQILGMGNQSSTMGNHKPPGDLTSIIKMMLDSITITLTPGLVTPALTILIIIITIIIKIWTPGLVTSAHHRPNYHYHNHHHHDHHHPYDHHHSDSRTGDPGPSPASSGKKETKEAQWLYYWQVWSWWSCWLGSKKSDLDTNFTI